MLRRLFPNVYEGWFVVGASGLVVLVVAATFFYGFGTIFQPLRDEFGWSAAVTSLAFSLRSEAGGLAAPLVGMALDRFEAQRVLLVGIVIAAAGVFGLSFTQELWQFYLAILVIAVGTSGAGGQVGLVTIATWFRVRRARAMSFMTMGGAMGGLLVVVVAWVVETAGWRDALRVLAIAMLVLGGLAAVNVRKRPPHHPQPIDGRLGLVARNPAAPSDDLDWGMSLRAAARTRAFLLIGLAMMATSFSTTALIVHQIPYLEEELDISKSLASSSVAVFTVSSVAGRLGFSFLADRGDKRVAWMMSTLLIVIGLPVLIVATAFWQVLLAILLIAPGFGGMIPIRPALMADYFGVRYLGAITGTAQMLFTTGGFAGPLVVGLLVDTMGDYDLAWAICAAVTALAVPALYFARPPGVAVATPVVRDAASPLGS